MDPRNFTQNTPGSLQYNPDGYWTYHPYALPPLFRWTDRLVKALSEADRAISRLSFSAANASDSFFVLTSTLEAVSSCRITGYGLSDEEFLLSEAAFSHVPHYRSESQKAVKRIAEALLACSKSSIPELSDFLAVHDQIWPGDYDPRWPPGQFRLDQTWIGTEEGGPEAAAFVPPPHDSMMQSLESLNDFIHDNKRIPELIRLAMVHYQISVIHPFYDANDRFNRLLVSRLMCAWGLLPGPCMVISSYYESHAAEYRTKLSGVSRENAWEDWIVFFLNGLRAQADLAINLLESLDKIRALLFAQLSGERTVGRLMQVVDLSIQQGYVTVNQVDALFPQANFKSATRYVRKLVELGVLEEVTGRVRHRVFRLKVLTDILNQEG